MPTAISQSSGTFQSTHSLRSATLSAIPGRRWNQPVSIHALLAECDPRHAEGVSEHVVSIHALLAECDALAPQTVYVKRGFNPRTPCGVRPVRQNYSGPDFQFQSTHSLRSATIISVSVQVKLMVSIHALLAECDCAQPYTLLLNKANHTLRQPP